MDELKKLNHIITLLERILDVSEKEFERKNCTCSCMAGRFETWACPVHGITDLESYTLDVLGEHTYN